MFDIILTVVIFNSVSALILFVIFALSSSVRIRSVRRQADTAQAREQEYSPNYSHS